MGKTERQYTGYLTVKKLKEAIKHLPDDTPVYYNRVEDRLFKKGGWDTEEFIVPTGLVGMDDTLQAIRAFTARVVLDGHGAVILIAHY